MVASPTTSTVIPNQQIKCRKCLKRVLTHSKTIFCSLCQSVTHTTCLDLYTKDDIDYSTNAHNNWTCPTCLMEVFPLTSVEEPREFSQVLAPDQIIDFSHLEDLLLNPFKLSEEIGVLDDIDPDANFYNSERQNTQTQYLTIDSLNDQTSRLTGNKLFLTFHTNIRSTKKNMVT